MSDPGTLRDSDAGRWLTYDELACLRGINQQSAVKLVRRQQWRRQTGNRGTVRVFVPDEWLSRPWSQDEPGQAGTEPGTSPGATQDSPAAVEAVLAALREAHAGEIERLTEALGRSKGRADAERSRADVLLARTDDLRAEIVAIEAKLRTEAARADELQGRLAEAEQIKEAARKRAHELANRMMTLEAAAEQGREAKERLTGLDSLLADSERRLAESDTARRTAQERIDAMDRAEVARRGRGRWARLRAAWRGE
jgi:hypothetical protein